MSNVIRAFTREQASKVTGVSPRRMAYWARCGVLTPSILYDTESHPYSYMYDFVDVVGLRTLGVLRDKHHLSLQQLRTAYTFLREHSNRPWSDLRFWIRGKELFFRDPRTHDMMTPGSPAKRTLEIELEPVVSTINREIERIRQRQPEQIGQISQHRLVQGNRPTVMGTRVPVSSVLSLAEDGYEISDIVDAFPALTEADVRSILEHSLASNVA